MSKGDSVPCRSLSKSAAEGVSSSKLRSGGLGGSATAVTRELLSGMHKEGLLGCCLLDNIGSLMAPRKAILW